jgi:hypothetical protein
MKRLTTLLMVLFVVLLQGQHLVKGYLVNQFGEALPNCKLSIADFLIETFSDERGFFSLEYPPNLSQGELLIETPEGESQWVPLDFSRGSEIDLGYWKVTVFQPIEESQPQMDWELLAQEDSGLDRAQIGSILQSQRDVFLNTAAFQFSSTFYRLRGLGTQYQEVQLNGIPIQSFFKGSPQWSQWGGLNDFTNRGQQLFLGASPQIYSRGGFLSTTQINLQPSLFRAGAKISQAFSNNSYQYRTQFSMVKPPQENRLGYGVIFSHRGGKQGYVQGTLYDAFSAAFLVEKNWSNQHATWVTALYTPNSRGKSAPLTEEVLNLKGRQYNPYWGWQQGRIRNSRRVETKTPILLVNHRWELSEQHLIKLNLGFVWGSQRSSRLAYNGHQLIQGVLHGGGSNPDPIYYQYLPSYALKNGNAPDFERAYLLQQELLLNGQVDWLSLYNSNRTPTGHALYLLTDDVQQLHQQHARLQYSNRLAERLNLGAELGISREQSTFFAQPIDLLGAESTWNYNSFASTDAQLQFNLLEPDQKVVLGDIYQYHYGIHTVQLSSAAAADYQVEGWNFFGGVSAEKRSYQREGFYQNGSYPAHSFGKGNVLSFLTFSAKGGIGYALTGRHRFLLEGQWQQQPPAYKNCYVNPRENEYSIPGSTFEINTQLVLTYRWQGQIFDVKLSSFALKRKNTQEVSYYFADGIGGDQALFIQEITQGIDFNHLGLEGSVEVAILPELKLAGVVSLGDYRYANNPQLYLGTAPSDETLKLQFENGIKSMGQALLKNYSLAGGPQQAFSLSLHYEDPNYWRMSLFGNFFSNAFLDPNPVLRTANFYTDRDGLPFASYEVEEAKKLLKQEQFPSYFLLNAIAGKSWRIGTHYAGFFISLQNILDTHYLTGGFEQGRNANFISLREDSNRLQPLFSPKYWWGRGSTYFISTYYRF